MKTATQTLLAQKREALKTLRYEIKTLSENVKADKVAATKAKQEAKALKAFEKKQKEMALALKRQDRIAKMEARLQKMKDKQNPVGAKAVKASKRPSKAIVTTFA